MVGLILTIAEGPNPFGFLLPLSLPGFYLLRALARLVPVLNAGGIFMVLLGLPLNLLLYFLVGYLIDYIVNRFWNRQRV